MNEKHKKLKKALVASSIKAAIIIIGCSIGLGSSYYFYQDSTESIKRLKSKDRKLKSKVKNLKKKNDKSSKTLALYDQLTKDSNLRSLDLNRRNISTLLDTLGGKYKIENLAISISPLTERKEGPFLKKTGTIITTQIAINFDSMSDIHAFAFTDELFQNFSGYLNLKSFSVRRNREVSEAVLKELLKEGRTNFVSGSIIFDWLGLRPNPEEEAKKAS